MSHACTICGDAYMAVKLPYARCCHDIGCRMVWAYYLHDSHALSRIKHYNGTPTEWWPELCTRVVTTSSLSQKVVTVERSRFSFGE